MSKAHAGKVIGESACELCGAPVEVKLTSSGLASYVCHAAKHGGRGCGRQVFERDQKSHQLQLRRITKWHGGFKKELLGEATPSRKGPPIKAEPSPPPATKGKSFLARLMEEDPD